MLRKKFRQRAGQTQIILKKIIGETDKVRQLTGSRYSDGNVPNVNWNDDKMNVNWYNPDNADDNLRARQKFPKRSPLSRIFF